MAPLHAGGGGHRRPSRAGSRHHSHRGGARGCQHVTGSADPPDSEVGVRRITSRRTPDGHQRRRDLCDAAIQLLADRGAKGLSHPQVDRQAGVPDGSTSYYFRTRDALVHAVAERVAELDLADLLSVTDVHANTPMSPQRAASKLAAVVMKSLTGAGLT